MAYGEETKAAIPEVTREDIRWINERIRKLRKELRMVIAILVDKKLVGVELAKRIEESKQEDKALIEWLMSTLPKKEE